MREAKWHRIKVIILSNVFMAGDKLFSAAEGKESRNSLADLLLKYVRHGNEIHIIIINHDE